MENKYLVLAKRIQALADTGLLYNKEDYDRERYTELKSISHELMSLLSEEQPQTIGGFYGDVTDYPTPKTDVRVLVLNGKQEILMVQEKVDECWTLPGGWADIGFTPSEVAAKECKEETGLDIRITRLLAVFDKRCHPHPPQPHYVYKMVFLGELIDPKQQPRPAFDTKDIAFFSPHSLPTLSEERILPLQIARVFEQATGDDKAAIFD